MRALCAVLCAASGFGASSAFAQETVLVRMLQEGQNPKVRAGAAALIGRSKDLERRPELEGALRDEHPVVRAAAAGGLGKMGSRSSLQPLHDVAKHDRVQGVAREARAAISAIENQPGSVRADADANKGTKPRYALVLGEMRNQSSNREPQLVEILGRAVERNLSGLESAAVLATAQKQRADAAQAAATLTPTLAAAPAPTAPELAAPKPTAAPAPAVPKPLQLSVFRLDGTVTSLVTSMVEGQLSVHCEVSLLVMDQPTGSLRTLLRGAARGVEIPTGERALQELAVTSRVVDAAVRSALRNADNVILDAARPPGKPRVAATSRTAF